MTGYTELDSSGADSAAASSAAAVSVSVCSADVDSACGVPPTWALKSHTMADLDLGECMPVVQGC